MDILKRIYEYEPSLINKILNYYYVYRFNDVIKNINTTKINTDNDLKRFWRTTRYTYFFCGPYESKGLGKIYYCRNRNYLRKKKLTLNL